METTITLIETLKDQIRGFDYQPVIKLGMELAEKFDITEFCVQVSSRQKNLPLFFVVLINFLGFILITRYKHLA